MTAALSFLLLMPGAYLFGAVPWGVIIGRLAGGVDVRQHGSRNTGMTNVLRTVGFRAAILVLALDVAKGIAVVMAARLIAESSGLTPLTRWYLEMACGLSALVGHNWSVFLLFRGGRGIATGFGTLLAISPWTGIVAAGAFLPVMGVSRYVSLGSLVGVSVGGVGLIALTLMGVYPTAYGIYGAIGAAIIVFRHRDNIRRLLSGTEARLGRRPPPPPEAFGGDAGHGG